MQYYCYLAFTIRLTQYLAVIAMVCLVGCFWAWKKLLEKLKKSAELRSILTALEAIVPVVCTAAAGIFDVYKSDAWSLPSPSLANGLAIVVFGIVWLVTVKVSLWQAKEKDKQAISELEAEIESLCSQNDALVAQCEWRARLSALSSELIEWKCDELRKLKKSRIDIGDFLGLIDPTPHIIIILMVLHDLYKRRLPPGRTLRLAVYMLSPDGKFLVPIYAWDGNTDKCFSGSSRQYMSIDNPAGSRTLMTQLYHSAESFRMISDCAKANVEGEFTYLRPEQHERIKSIVAAKKIIRTAKKRKKIPNVLILTMDSNENGFFDVKDKEAIKLSLEEVLKRLEFELLCLGIRRSIHPPINQI